jgi:plasmid stabilization system protein ParE
MNFGFTILATVWYTERSISAARRFRDNLRAAFSSAVEFPLRYPA